MFRVPLFLSSLTRAVLAVVAITLVVVVLVLTAAEVVAEVKVVLHRVVLLVLRAPPLLTAGRLVAEIALQFWNGER